MVKTAGVSFYVIKMFNILVVSELRVPLQILNATILSDMHASTGKTWK